jgi:hypothetical protein
MVSYIQAYCSAKQYGRELNRAINNAFHDWVCVTDLDTMFLYEHSGTIIEDAISYAPENTILSCFTNRCAHKHQLINEHFSYCGDVTIHYQIAKRMADVHWADCIDLPPEKSISGFLMIFNKHLHNQVPFMDGLRNANGCFFDVDFIRRAKQAGYKLRLIKGLYVMHYYRFHKDRHDAKHITGKKHAPASN